LLARLLTRGRDKLILHVIVCVNWLLVAFTCILCGLGFVLPVNLPGGWNQLCRTLTEWLVKACLLARGCLIGVHVGVYVRL
jgi:hypothetical protein